MKAYKGGVPASLQFVADRLFAEGQAELGARVLECALLLARANCVSTTWAFSLATPKLRSGWISTTAPLKRLAMISLGVNDPDGFVTSCFQKLE